MRVRVLIVEDEARLAQDLARVLRAHGFAADTVGSGVAGWELGGVELFDAAILDLGLPGIDGLSILRRWRSEGVSFPVIVLSARADWSTRVEAIDAGADDYLVKPFVMEELLARLRAVLRRAAGATTSSFSFGQLEIDVRRRRVTLAGAPLDLTPLEFRLIAYLAHHPGRAVSQAELVDHLYADERDRHENAVEALVARLRRKAGQEVIRTRRGYGYEIGTAK